MAHPPSNVGFQQGGWWPHESDMQHAYDDNCRSASQQDLVKHGMTELWTSRSYNTTPANWQRNTCGVASSTYTPSHHAAYIPPNTSRQGVVSFSPGATEIIAALGSEDRLVGVTEWCDFPESVVQNR